MSAIFLSMVSPCGLLVRSGETRRIARVSPADQEQPGNQWGRSVNSIS
jgi:hypothetical protein